MGKPTAISKTKKVALSPTNAELKHFLTVVRIALLDANNRGARISKEAKRVLKWLEEGAPCVHQKSDNLHALRNKK